MEKHELGRGGEDKEQEMLNKLMPHLWRLNNLIDRKAIHIKAWLTAVTDEPWDHDIDDDPIMRLCRKYNGR